MNTKWMNLAATLLEEASDSYSNHGCNDWEFPSDWTHEQKHELVKAFEAWNGSPEDYDPGSEPRLEDFAVMAFLADYIRVVARSTKESR